MKKSINLKKLTRIAILGTIGGLLMLIDFPIFIAPSFYKLDFSDLPCLIGAFAMGPISGLFIQIIRIIVKLLLKPTSTAFVGEIAAFIFSCVYCLVASIIYQNNRTKKGAYIAIVIGSLSMIIVSAISNYSFIIPFYSKLYNMPLEAIISLGSAIFPMIDSLFEFVICCVMPFNIIKTIIVSGSTMLLYKRIAPLLKG